MVATERSPPLWRVPVSSCSSSLSRNLTRIWGEWGAGGEGCGDAAALTFCVTH